MAYDSQVILSIEVINGDSKNCSIMRVGRFYFALQAEQQEVYLYKRDPKVGYVLDVDNPMKLIDKRNIAGAILMIQGKKTPTMVKLPVKASIIQKDYKKEGILKEAP